MPVDGGIQLDTGMIGGRLLEVLPRRDVKLLLGLGDAMTSSIMITQIVMPLHKPKCCPRLLRMTRGKILKAQMQVKTQSLIDG